MRAALQSCESPTVCDSLILRSRSDGFLNSVPTAE